MQTYRNRVSVLSQLSPFLKLPKYFESKWSYAKFRLPAPSSHIALSSALSASSAPLSASADLVEDDRCVVGWIEAPSQQQDGTNRMEYQLVVLTHSGGWYRLALPSPSTIPAPTAGPTFHPVASVVAFVQTSERRCSAYPSAVLATSPEYCCIEREPGQGQGS